MADKFTKVAVPVKEEAVSPADAWKHANVEKEHTPAKVKSTVTYAQLENQVAQIDAEIAHSEERKAAVEAEMVKVKAAAEA
tara:strand:+ start:464 stop:706 length:243 start_codon:yes stop_codon:yes gene_type:complete